ncbi:MAG: hypothetical protein Q9174_004592 [Haloplaca sp. 1 TL-2023]
MDQAECQETPAQGSTHLQRSQCTLLGLPREVRDHIYSFIDNPRDIGRSLWACRQLYDETHQIFYNRFVLKLDVFSDAGRHVHETEVRGDDDGNGRRVNRRYFIVLADQNGKGVVRQLKTLPDAAKSRLRNVSLFVPFRFGPPRVPAHRPYPSRCLCPECVGYGKGLCGRLMALLRSETNLHASIKVHYHLGSTLEIYPRWKNPNIDDTDLMLSLFKTDGGLPQCTTLAICCSIERLMEPERSPGYDGCIFPDTMEQWSSLCNTLATIMQAGSYLQHFEVWIPAWFWEKDDDPEEDIILSVVTQEVRDWQSWVPWRKYPVAFWEPLWVHCLTKIQGLKSVKIMRWNDRERTSEQSVPVKAVEVEGFQEFLDSKMVTRE